jgi:hypothetical protein
MTYFAWLEKTVAGAIAQQRIGSLVSLRAFFQLSADHGRLMGILGEALAAAGKWFGSRPVRVYALGGIKAGEITAMIEYSGGETALVSAGVLRDPVPIADLMLIGNRGTLRHQDSPQLGEPGRGDEKLLRAIEKSLVGQAPVEVEK